jgi:hypothetical protein
MAADGRVGNLISRYALACGSGIVARGNRMLAHGG